MKKKQFTLIEMLVVIAIISVLATMIGTAIVSMKEKGNKTTCLSNLKNLHAAIMQYQQSNNNNCPIDGDGDSFNDTKDGGNHERLLYLIRRTEAGDDPNLYKCPSAASTVLGSSKSRGELSVTYDANEFGPKNNSYAYHMGNAAGLKAVKLNNASGIVSDGWAGGTNINDANDDGWNHKGSGNWFTMGGSGKQAESDTWPDQVGYYGTKGDWGAFRLW